VNVKTARRYIEAAVAAGLVRDGGEGQLSEELLGAVRPARPDGHGDSWELLVPQQERIGKWVKAGLTVTRMRSSRMYRFFGRPGSGVLALEYPWRHR
jgi:hypothetical protein